MSKQYRIVCLPGDGIGPEITTQALRVLERVAALEGFEIEIETQLIGGHAIDMTGTPLPQATLDACTRAHAVLLGAVGGPKWDEHPPELRPEKGLLAIRKALGLYNNLRPVTVYEPLIEASTLKPEVVRGTDLLVVRELTGGIYFGQPRHTRELDGKRIAVDTLVYDETEIRRIAIAGFEAARGRRKHLTSVDKANVLDSSRLWRKVVNEVAEAYPDVKLDHLLVDNCAMQLIRNPRQFDVIVTENMFGDILSDEASMLSGSIGMLSSASLGEGTGLYEPAHGSAPDIAGKDIANPLATILSVALLLRYSLQEEPAARRIELAVGRVLEQGYRCADIRGDIQGNIQGDIQGGILTEGNPVLGTTAMAEQVIREL